MKQRFAAFLLLVLVLSASTVHAEFYGRRTVSAPVIFVDLALLRPFGFALSVFGTAFFIGTLPFSAIANLAPPQDALERTANALIIGPGAFTFQRPLGEFSYNANGIYPLRPGEPLGTGYPPGSPAPTKGPPTTNRPPTPSGP